MTDRRMISGLLWKYLNRSGFGMLRGHETALPCSTGFLLTPPLGDAGLMKVLRIKLMERRLGVDQ